MARIYSGNPGSNTAGEFYNSGGTWSVQTTTKRSARTRSAVRINPTTTAVGYVQIGAPTTTTAVMTDMSLTTGYHQLWFNYTTKAASNWEEIASVMTFGGSTVKLIVALNSSGNLAVYNKSAVLVATGSTVLSSGTWYCIEIKSGNGSSAAYEVRINGVSELSGTCDQGANTSDVLTIGKKTDRNSNTVDYYFGEFVVDDAAYPGCSTVVHIVPNANGSTMNCTSGTGSSDYTTVDECPLDNTDYVMSPASAGKIALFRFDTCATAGITGTINAVSVVTAGVRENTSVTSSNKMRVKSGATNSDSNAIDLTTTDRTRQRFYATDPNTSVAWTTSGVDALEAGMIEANAVSVRLAQVFVSVEFTPAVVGDPVAKSRGACVGSGAGA